MMLETMLEDAGHRVMKAARVAKGLLLAMTEPFDFAILDVRVAGEVSYPVASELRRRGIPFVFASGYASDNLVAEFRDAPVLRKPYRVEDVREALRNAARSPT